MISLSCHLLCLSPVSKAVPKLIIAALLWGSAGAMLASRAKSAASPPAVFYDAAQSYFKRDGTQQVFSGDVVVIGGGYVVAADRISIDREAGMLAAQGNVLVAGEEHALSASSAYYWWATRDFVVTDAQLVISDRRASARLRRQILARGSDRAQRLARRQRLWLQTRHAGEHEMRQSYYLKFRSTSIARRQLDFWQADEAVLTPCRCEGDEPPVFALRARRIEAVADQHIDFNKAVVEVHGLPVFFLPLLRLPLERKSGLLFPVFGHRKQTGFSISQPFFFAVNERADATAYLDWLQQRGLRLAVSSRGRLSPQHHWQLLAEGLRDRRHDNASPWRGTVKWQRVHFLTPRLSVGSEGDVSSDVNYNRDLYWTRRGEPQFDLNPYAARRLWLHLDHPDFYAGIDGHLAGSTEVFGQGEQLSANFTLQSRHVQLLDLPAFKTWVQARLQQQHIGRWQKLRAHQRAHLRAVNVLLGTALDVEQFWEVAAQRLVDPQRSQQHTWRTGLRVSLPLDGRMALPADDEQTRTLQHLVRLNAGIVMQPQVWTQGKFQQDDKEDYYLATSRFVPSEVWELELEQAWRINTQMLPRQELAGMPRTQHVPQHTHTPLSLRVSTQWDRRQATRRRAAQARGTHERLAAGLESATPRSASATRLAVVTARVGVERLSARV